MTYNEISIVIGIVAVFAILIIWSYRSTSKFKNRHDKPKEDPWDHLSLVETDPKGKLGFEPHRFSVKLYKRSEEKPVVGEWVKLWNKPGTDEVNLYAKGSAGGQGLLGWIANREISDHVEKNGKYEAEIIAFDNSDVFLVEIKLSENHQ